MLVKQLAAKTSPDFLAGPSNKRSRKQKSISIPRTLWEPKLVSFHDGVTHSEEQCLKVVIIISLRSDMNRTHTLSGAELRY